MEHNQEELYNHRLLDAHEKKRMELPAEVSQKTELIFLGLDQFEEKTATLNTWRLLSYGEVYRNHLLHKGSDAILFPGAFSFENEAGSELGSLQEITLWKQQLLQELEQKEYIEREGEQSYLLLHALKPSLNQIVEESNWPQKAKSALLEYMNGKQMNSIMLPKEEVFWQQFYLLCKRKRPAKVYIANEDKLLKGFFQLQILTMIGYIEERLTFKDAVEELCLVGYVFGKDRAGNYKKMVPQNENLVLTRGYLLDYGKDALRMALIFAGPAPKDMQWKDASCDGMDRFLRRIWKMYLSWMETNRTFEEWTSKELSLEPGFHKQIAELMKIQKRLSEKMREGVATQEELCAFLDACSVFAPSLTHELKSRLCP